MPCIFKLFILFESDSDITKKLSYREMLRTGILAFSAGNAVACFSAVLGMHAVIKICIPAFPGGFAVHTGKQIGNGNVFGATVCTVFAGCALY